MLAAFENATNLRQEEVKVTFDCAEEEDFHADGHDVHDGHDDTPEGDPFVRGIWNAKSSSRGAFNLLDYY